MFLLCVRLRFQNNLKVNSKHEHSTIRINRSEHSDSLRPFNHSNIRSTRSVMQGPSSRTTCKSRITHMPRSDRAARHVSDARRAKRCVTRALAWPSMWTESRMWEPAICYAAQERQFECHTKRASCKKTHKSLNKRFCVICFATFGFPYFHVAVSLLCRYLHLLAAYRFQKFRPELFRNTTARKIQ